MQKDMANGGESQGISPTSPEVKRNSTVSPILRARCFPRKQPPPTPPLSRRSTAADGLAFRSSESISEQLCLLSGAPSVSALNADPYMTVFYPPSDALANGKEIPDEPQYRNDAVRTQVRVEGYFHIDDDTLGVLIPNDLPRSTILYVLTASDGRDKLTKCLQYGFQGIVCLLKRPQLFSPDVQSCTEYWAERFWRNGNTIRHGRGLFKLGRWIMNIYYLQEVCDRLLLKHGTAIRDVLRDVRAALLGALPWDTVRRSGCAFADRTQRTITPTVAALDLSTTPESLLIDDVYTHVARVECSRQQKLPHHTSFPEHHGTRDKGSEVDGVLQPFHVQDMTNSTTMNIPSRKDTPLSQHYLKVRQQHQEILHKQQKPKPQQHQQRQPQASEQGGCSVDETLRPNSLLSTPPSIQLTLPENPAMGDARVSRNAPLLKPLSRTMDDEASLQVPASQEAVPLETQVSGTQPPEDVGRVFFGKYQKLPYTIRMDDTLPNVSSRARHSIGNGVSRSSNCLASRGNNNTLQDNDGVNMNSFQSTLRQNSIQEVESTDIYDLHYGLFSNSDISINSSTLDSSKGTHNGEHFIPGERANPVHWRKRMLDFSTPLMILLGIRSAATIGRRVMRDILLLSSKHFFNLVYVEQNRPSLQRRANWLWLIVACIDLLLNTVRLANRGWYKYATARQSGHYRCACTAGNSKDIVWRSRGFLARRKTDLVFPPLDLDFGAPLASSPAFFEAAAPEHMAPVCNTCGCLFIENHAKDSPFGHSNQQERSHREWESRFGRSSSQENARDSYNEEGFLDDREDAEQIPFRPRLSIGDKRDVAILFIPWLMRKLFNYIWLLRTHPNWTETILLQIHYMAEVYLALKYCFGGYETGKSDSSLVDVLHPCGAAAGLIGAIISLHRVIESAPK